MESGALLGLGSAAAFGLCDFLAGVASRRLSFWWVTLASLAVSATGAWGLVALGRRHPTETAVVWALAAGVGAATGASGLYRGYGRGQMAVAGPLSAVGTAAIPAVVGAALGERLPPSGLAGIVLAMPAIWLMASAPASGSGMRTGVSDGLVSGAGFALEFIGLERADDQSGLWPVAVSQSTALLLVAAAVVALRTSWRGGDARSWSPAFAAGALSLLATSLYFLAAQTGLLTVAAVLAALYPGVTVILAALLLHEHPDRRQLSGLCTGAVAVTLIVIA
ncbi:MAG: DMT family transporter [Nocardioides sp.]|nr:DMT family transporter [Nocardioides sp.]